MRAILALLLVVFSTSWAPQAVAESQIQGEWKQLASNAGQCADCRVAIERNGSGFTVTANNGWSAVVRPKPDGKYGITGRGKWKPGAGGSYGGTDFLLFLAVIDDKLYMIMTVPKPSNRISEIKAVFERQLRL
jgi:hypothetical protein